MDQKTRLFNSFRPSPTNLSHLNTPPPPPPPPLLPTHIEAGLNGLIDPVEPGISCGSDTAHMSILGYDPRTLYRGRGAFESMGAGLNMSPGDIAFKCNFANLDTTTNIVVSRRVDRNFETEGPTLCSALDGLKIPGFSEEYQVAVKYAKEHRCGLVVRGPGLTDGITGTDPLKDQLPLITPQPLDALDKAACHTAQVVAALSKAIQGVLEEHPINKARKEAGKPVANVLLLRGCGVRLALEPFDEKYKMKSAVIAPTQIIAGLALSLGMTVRSVPGATGDYKTQLHTKAKAAVDILTSNNSKDEEEDEVDFVFLHVKAVDDASHDKNASLKVAFIEKVDTMVGQLIKQLAMHHHHDANDNDTTNNDNYRSRNRRGRGCSIVVTGDHSSPIIIGDHSHEPVPFTIAHFNDVVELLGGVDAIEASIPLEPIVLPDDEEAAANGGIVNSCSSGERKRKRRKKIGSKGDTSALVDIHGDDVDMFNEISAAQGALGRFPGSEIMKLITRFACRSIDR